MNPKLIAEGILGPVRWESDTRGFCRCPGEALHTTPTRKDACRVNIDGAPTVYCFHSHCAGTVDAANRQLRRALSSGAPPAPSLSAHRPPPALAPGKDERTERAREIAPRIFEELPWPYERILEASPMPVRDWSPKQQFLGWLGIWPLGAIVWTGDVTDTGERRHLQNFRGVEAWKKRGAALGNFTSAAAYKPGSFSRCAEQVERRCFMVVESDTLSKDQVGAVFRYLWRRAGYQLQAIVDTGGKSLHGWFLPPDQEQEQKLKALLTGLGCDPKMFGLSQPCRVPGVMRGDRLQRLLWLRRSRDNSPHN